MVGPLSASLTYDHWGGKGTRKSLFVSSCHVLFITDNQHLLLPTLGLVELNPGLRGKLLALQGKQRSCHFARRCTCACVYVCACVCTCSSHVTCYHPASSRRKWCLSPMSGEMTVFAQEQWQFGASPSFSGERCVIGPAPSQGSLSLCALPDTHFPRCCRGAYS